MGTSVAHKRGSRGQWVVPPPPVTAVKGQRMGFSLGAPYRPGIVSLPNFTAHCAAIAATGCKIIRLGALYPEYNSNGVTRIRQMVNIAKAAGLKVILLVGQSIASNRAPRYSSGVDGSGNPIYPYDINWTPGALFTTGYPGYFTGIGSEFLPDLVSLDAEEAGVIAVICSNEANLRDFWPTSQTFPDPSKYGNMLKVCWESFKAVSAAWQVWTTNTSPRGSGATGTNQPAGFLAVYADSGYFDAVCHDGYPPWPGSYNGQPSALGNNDWDGFVGAFRTIIDVLKAISWTGQVHCIETGYFTAQISAGGNSGVSEDTQSAQMRVMYDWWFNPSRSIIPDSAHPGIELGVILNYGFGSFKATDKEGSFGVYQAPDETPGTVAQGGDGINQVGPLTAPKLAYATIRTIAAEPRP